MKETETSESTPEQLFEMLEAQLAMQRSHRTSSGRNRAIFLAGGVLFIVVAAGAALLVLDEMLMNMGLNGRPVASAPVTTSGKF